MCALTAVFFIYKNKILPNPNAAYEELYSTFKQAEGTVVSFDRVGRRNSSEYTIQFRDQNDSLITVKEGNWQTMPVKVGDKVTMYYNPENPQQATTESRWKEIMRK
ncbi:MAG: DUF3592 domain-containing protein [Paludibacter sp.]|nr:DUF3592 domain-containing protein [Paludibacter sp.]